MIELLLLGILIMQIVTFHSTADKFGRYAKMFETLIHRPTKYLEQNIIFLCKLSKLNYQKVKGKIKAKRED